MKAFVFAIMALGALSVAANAEPVKLSAEKMATITAGDNPHNQNVHSGKSGGCPQSTQCTPPTGKPVVP